MGAVERIFESLGNMQARAAEGRAQLWANAVQQSGQIPLQIQQQKRLDALTLLEQAKVARDQGDLDLAQKKFAEAERTHQNQKQITAAMFADPTKPDVTAGVQKAIALGEDPAFAYELGEKFKPKPINVAAGGSLVVPDPTAPTGYRSAFTAPPKVEPGSLGEYVQRERAILAATGQQEQPGDLLKWNKDYHAATRTEPAADAALDAYARALHGPSAKAEDLTDAERQNYAKRQATIASNQAFFQHTRERQYDIANPVPEKTADQSKLEQQYRTVLTRAVSSRSGGLGAEDQKVDQANHLLALLDQTYDPKTGNYNLPKTLQGELAAGLARLVAPGGSVGIEMMREFDQRTAKGDIAGALTYVTGHPFPTATQDFAKLLKDSIERQGTVAAQNREGYMGYLRGLAPTDLEEGRRERLESGQLVPLRQSRIIQNKQTGERKLQVSTDGGKTWQ